MAINKVLIALISSELGISIQTDGHKPLKYLSTISLHPVEKENVPPKNPVHLAQHFHFPFRTS